MNPLLTVEGIPTESRWRPSEKKEPDVWGTAIGAWGDTLACVGEFLRYPSEGGILHYGFDPAIVEFLRCQPFVEAAENLTPLNQQDYLRTVLQSNTKEDFRPFALFDGGNLVPTHLRPSVLNAHTVNRWHGAKLPRRARSWAANWLSMEVGNRPCILFQPYSFQSEKPERHWQGWQEALSFLLTYTDYLVIVVGEGWKFDFQNAPDYDQRRRQHPRLINMVGQLADMTQAFALAELADGIVTTCNSLSMWSVIQNLPAVVMANENLRQSPFFWKWIDTEPNTLLPVTATFEDFVTEFCKRFM